MEIDISRFYWLSKLVSAGLGLRLTIHERKARNVKLINEPSFVVCLSGCSGCNSVVDIATVIDATIGNTPEIKEKANFYSPIK